MLPCGRSVTTFTLIRGSDKVIFEVVSVRACKDKVNEFNCNRIFSKVLHANIITCSLKGDKNFFLSNHKCSNEIRIKIHRLAR